MCACVRVCARIHAACRHRSITEAGGRAAIRGMEKLGGGRGASHVHSGIMQLRRAYLMIAC